jgi:hypothetical protein
MKFNKKEFLESTVLGASGLIAFTIIAVIVYFIGLSVNIRSLRTGFVSEVVLIRDFPLFFILVALIKILIGGELIDWTTHFFSRILGIKILVEKRNPEQMSKHKK